MNREQWKNILVVITISIACSNCGVSAPEGSATDATDSLAPVEDKLEEHEQVENENDFASMATISSALIELPSSAAAPSSLALNSPSSEILAALMFPRRMAGVTNDVILATRDAIETMIGKNDCKDRDGAAPPDCKAIPGLLTKAPEEGKPIVIEYKSSEKSGITTFKSFDIVKATRNSAGSEYDYSIVGYRETAAGSYQAVFLLDLKKLEEGSKGRMQLYPRLNSGSLQEKNIKGDITFQTGALRNECNISVYFVDGVPHHNKIQLTAVLDKRTGIVEGTGAAIREELTTNPLNYIFVPSSLTEEFANVYRFVADPSLNISLSHFAQVRKSEYSQYPTAYIPQHSFGARSKAKILNDFRYIISTSSSLQAAYGSASDETLLNVFETDCAGTPTLLPGLCPHFKQYRGFDRIYTNANGYAGNGVDKPVDHERYETHWDRLNTIKMLNPSQLSNFLPVLPESVTREEI